MKLAIDTSFQSLLPPLSPEDKRLLEELLLREGCCDALVLWKPDDSDTPILLDGHHRYEICTRLNLSYQVRYLKKCPDRQAAIEWIVANQLSRRNLTPSQKAVLALEIEKQLAEEAKKRKLATQNNNGGRAVKEKIPYQDPGQARDKAAELIGVNPRYVQTAKKIAETAPELIKPIQQGKLTLVQAKQVAEIPKERRKEAFERIKRGEAITEGGYIYQDKELIEVKTNEEVENWMEQQNTLRKALKALSSLTVTPEEYLRGFSPNFTAEVEAQLEPAFTWLTQFRKAWRKYYDKKAA